MSITSVTSDGQEQVTSYTTTPAVATIQYGRKNGLPGYSNEECSVFLQIPLESEDLASIEKQLAQGAAFLKAFVANQLGLTHEVSPTGVVEIEKPVEMPKSASGSSKPYAGRVSSNTYNNPTPQPAPAGGNDAERRAQAWSDIAGATQNAQGYWRTQADKIIYDNRTNKKYPKGSDFTVVYGPDDKVQVWMDSAPAWFVGPGEGIAL